MLNTYASHDMSVHGRSMGALSVTSNPKYQNPFTPLIPGVDVGKINDLESLQTLITDETCGVIVEPIQGEGGINAASIEWLAALRKRCDDVGAVLIYDEIQVCFIEGNHILGHNSLTLGASADYIVLAVCGNTHNCPSDVTRISLRWPNLSQTAIQSVLCYCETPWLPL